MNGGRSERRRRGPWALAIFALGLLVIALGWWTSRGPAGPFADRREEGESAEGGEGGEGAEGADAGAAAEQRARRADAGVREGEGASTRAPVHLSEATLRADPSSAAGALSGTVVAWASGAPIAGAELSFAFGEATRSARSGPDGAFTFTPSEPGSYTLALATAEGFLPFAPEWGSSPIRFEARPGVRVEGARIVLVDAIAYTVEVTSAEGAPVAGASVRVHGLDRGERALAPMEDRFTTGEGGEARIHAPDGAVIEADHEAHGRGRGAVDSAAQVSHRVRIRLSRTPPEDERGDAELLGRVLDRGGAPIEGALLLATRSPGEGGALHPPLEGRSGEDGGFRIGGADRGRYRLLAQAEGYARGRADEVEAGVAAELRLDPEGRIRARVREAGSGAPLAAWTVIVERRRGALEWETLGSASGYGDAEIAMGGLPRGEVRVLATSPGHAPSEPIEAHASEAPPLTEIRLGRGGAIRGRLVSSRGGAPLAGARVTLEGRLGSGASAVPIANSALTDAEGRFELRGAPAGLRSVVAWAAGHHGRVRSGILVAEAPVDLGVLDLTALEEGEEARIELAGIGAVLRAEGDVLIIDRVVEGGGAAEAGLGAGDAILEIEGAPVGGLGFGGSIERIRGPEGTSVRLLLRRAGAEQGEPVSVPRRRIRA